MERLTTQSEANSSQEYNRIYLERAQKGVDPFDLKRWKKLIKYHTGGALLDIGCLDSQICRLMKHPTNYVGIDLAEKAIEEMKGNNQMSTFFVQDLYELPAYWKSRFEYIVMGEVLEHLEHPKKAIQSVMSALQENGVLAISVPLNEHKGEVDSERHLWSFSKSDIHALLKQYGKVKIKTIGSQWFPRYKYNHDVILAYCWKKPEEHYGSLRF